MCLIRNYSSWLQQTQMVVVRIIKDHISYMIFILYIHIHMCHKYEIIKYTAQVVEYIYNSIELQGKFYKKNKSW